MMDTASWISALIFTGFVVCIVTTAWLRNTPTEEEREKAAKEEARRVFRDRFIDDLEGVIADSLENRADVPALVLATYLMTCLEAHNATLNSDGRWYPGRTETQVFNETSAIYQRDTEENRQRDALNPDLRVFRRSLILTIDYNWQNDYPGEGKSYDLVCYLLDCLNSYNRIRPNEEKWHLRSESSEGPLGFGRGLERQE
jgi:hypothetical protein